MNEYNMLIIERTIAMSKERIAPGKHKIEVTTTIAKPGAPADVVLKVDGKEVASATVKRTVAMLLVAGPVAATVPCEGCATAPLGGRQLVLRGRS